MDLFNAMKAQNSHSLWDHTTALNFTVHATNIDQKFSNATVMTTCELINVFDYQHEIHLSQSQSLLLYELHHFVSNNIHSGIQPHPSSATLISFISPGHTPEDPTDKTVNHLIHPQKIPVTSKEQPSSQPLVKSVKGGKVKGKRKATTSNAGNLLG